MAHILVIEDDEDCAHIMIDALEMDNHTVTCVEDGAEGIFTLQRPSSQFDLILLDRMMPHMDGMEFLQKARELNLLKNLPVVMQTAADSESEVIEGSQEEGVYYYLTKPYEYQTLLAIVRSALS